MADGKSEPVTGYEVYRSPEFKALCARFGIAWDLGTREITLRLTEEDFVVTQVYLPEAAPPPASHDTTTLQNDRFRSRRVVPPQV